MADAGQLVPFGCKPATSLDPNDLNAALLFLEQAR
jgi:hypothetical protein